MTSNLRRRGVAYLTMPIAAVLLLPEARARTTAISDRSSPAPLQILRGDDDGDGVGNERDHCPHTPPGAVAIADGCASLEIVADPDVIAEPVQAAIETALNTGATMGPPGGLLAVAVDPVRTRLLEGQRQLGSGIRELAQGNVCAAAGIVREGAHTIEIASRDMAGVVLRTREALQSTVSPDDPDADAAEVDFHEIGYRGGLVGKALTATRALDTTVTALCDQVVEELPIPGIIANTDDAARIAQLFNGLSVAIADGAESGPLHEGARVVIDGVRFADGTGVAKRVVENGSDQIDPALVPDFAVKCMRLNIAPAQPFNPPLSVSGPYVLHEPSGYRGTFDSLVLEAPMRLAARSGGCTTSAGEDGKGKVQTFRYSLKLSYQPAGASFFNVFATDLTPSDGPVPFPAIALPTVAAPLSVGVLRATAQGQSCIGFPPKAICSSTVKVLSVDEYPVLIFQGGALASVNYATTLFDLEDWDATGFRVAQVASLTVHPFLSDASATFDAEGFPASGAPTIEHVTLPGNSFFAIRQQDFIGPGTLFPLATYGTEKRSGLKWPRAVGERHGHPAWYLARLPDIVRDLVALCSPGPNSFYRLPWAPDVLIQVGQGNNNPLGSHTGSQTFAFDVSLADGQTIRAIRGGTVDWLQETQTTVFDPTQPVSPTNQPFPAGSLQNWGNAVRIGHQDGTFAWYFHIETNGVLVNDDEQVQRGQPIARADNTGRSSGTHLHFQVQADNNNWGQSIQIRLDTDNLGGCYIPQTDDFLISNNANPNFFAFD
jgi:murein DD-endopeptidase MepM/ murein hydrolase activator NlpD